MTQNTRKYCLAPDEEEPHHKTNRKRYSTKVMFLAAVDRPRCDTERKQRFDGKLGFWPFVTIEVVKKK